MAESLARFDVTIIGGGPGGYVAAIRAAQLGFKTAIIEGHKLGGECLNYGCIPSKALITAGHVVDKIKSADKMGITVSGFSVDLAKLIDWKSSVVKTLTGGIGQLLKANGVTHFKGQGSFVSRSSDGKTVTLSVDAGIDPYHGTGSSGEKTQIQSDRVIIATGSTIAQIPSMPFDGKTILHSRDALEVKSIPKKITLVGGGVIGLEIGTFFAKLGTELTVVEATGSLLPGTDKECVDVVAKKLAKKGVKVHLNAKALGAQKTSSGISLEIQTPTEKLKLDSDWILVAVGRRPRTQGLNLEAVGLKADERGFIPVNNRLETKVSGIFAIGDVVGNPMLAHKASKEGLIAVETMKDPGITMDIRSLPWAIFSDPEIAGVGHTEESARAAGWDPVVGKCPFAANGRALTAGESDGFVKIISDRKTDQLLGCHMVGPDVSNLVAEVALAIEMGATSEDISRTVHAHPTLPETLMEAAESVHGMAVHFFEKKARRGSHAPAAASTH